MTFTSTGSQNKNIGRADGQHGTPSNYAFFVHSQVSLTQNIPPRVDNHMMARQKRRRTSPEDHTILEAAYQQNSKPDKSERTAIAKRVALGEKEVQIWFQNRRQNDRRKSRPLLPHEMLPHFRNSIPQQLLHESTRPSPESTPQSSFSSVEERERSHSSSTNRCDDNNRSSSRASSIHDLLNPVTPTETSFSSSFEFHHTEHTNAQSSQSTTTSCETESSLTSRDCQDGSAPSSSRSNKAENGVSRTESAQLAKKLTPSENCNATAMLHSAIPLGGEAGKRLCSGHTVSANPPATSRKRAFDEMEEFPLQSLQSSGVRLSMALDGAVKVRTTDEETPSPPKQRLQAIRTLRKEGLRRSHSAATTTEVLRSRPQDGARPTSGIFGRSRDARTWEFYCDGDARAALSAQAENDNKGSAVGAINLIRSQSQNAKTRAQHLRKDVMLKPKVGAGNARRQTALLGQKPKLVRALSSMARLPGSSKDGNVDSKKSWKASHARSLSGDSDKENWAPGTRSSDHALRRMQPLSSASRNVLQADFALAKAKTGGKRHGQEGNKQSGYDQENSLLVKEGHQADKEEDLNCIHGLLSLSQGAWG